MHRSFTLNLLGLVHSHIFTTQPLSSVAKTFILKCVSGNRFLFFHLDTVNHPGIRQVKYGTQRASPSNYDKVSVPTLFCVLF